MQMALIDVNSVRLVFSSKSVHPGHVQGIAPQGVTKIVEHELCCMQWLRLM